ncbi:DUF3352 domain-containing protein [Ancylothrix sp. C2]|uniref:DUF3352 domain-containing protein n=1 Tax=Ancylothrix sp. D3o TaxID=2953691 RepID=UPI0021BB0449|nr:DUF3352 domain-containing protein [Ancylothrix sp. D3o]MCT7951566.1 DUF3352 domain-containing protein [Ancylothrix sp. D3o]
MNRFVFPLVAIVGFNPVGVFAQSVTPPSTSAPPAVTKVLPSSMAGVVLFNTSKENWGKFNRFNPFPFDISGPGFLPFLPSGIDYQTNVQPWIADWAAVGVFVPQPAADGMFGELWDSAVMVMPVRDQAGANNFVAKVREVQPQTPIERVYKGVQVIEWEEKVIPLEEYPDPMPPSEEEPQAFAPISRFLPRFFGFTSNQNQRKLAQENSPPAEPAPEIEPSMPPDPESEETFPDIELTVTQPGYAIALLPGYVVTANKAKVLEQLIDSQAGISSVANDASFQRTLKHPKFGESVLVGYSNVAEAVKVVPVMPSQSLPSWIKLGPAEMPAEEMPAEISPKQEKPGEMPAEKMPTEEFPPEEIPAEELPPEEIPAEEFPPENVPSFSEVFNRVLQELGKEYDSIDALGWIDEQGVRSQSNAYFNKLQPELATQASPDDNKVLTRLPGATYISTNSRNLKRQWDLVVQRSGEEGKPFFDAMRQGVLNNTGLDLDKDIFGWMDREYALLLFPSEGGLLPTIFEPLKIGLSFMVQTSDRATAEKTIARLEEVLRTSSNDFFTKNTRTVGNETVVSWEGIHPEKGNQSVLSYRWTEDNTLIITTGTSPMARLTPTPNPSLANTYLFQTATNSFQRPNSGYYFINWGAALSFAYTLIPPVYLESEFASIGKQALGSIRSLSGSWLTTPEKEQSDFMIMIAPARK